MKKVTVRPSRAVSALGCVVALAMAGFGVSTLEKFGSFGVLFILVALAIGVIHLLNVLGKGGATKVIEVSGEAGSDSADDRLRRLENLRARRLISDSEYAEKRAAILDGL